jgi:putative hydrolase of the HAD superfamily
VKSEKMMKAVLFDLGHTLINYHNDWRGPERKAVGNVAKMVCQVTDSCNEKDVKTYLLDLLDQGKKRKLSEQIEIPLPEVLNDCYAHFDCDGDDTLVLEGMEAFYAVLLERRKLVPGAKEMLEDVQVRGYSIGLISDVAWGLTSDFPMRDVRHFGLDEYFDDMVFSTDVGIRKPNPRIFKMALFNLGVKAEESVYVGNNLQADIKGALGVGMTAVLKRSDFYEHDDAIVPSTKISTWGDFRHWLDEQESSVP